MINKTKQVSILLPEDVIKKAEKVARQTNRTDGLRQTPTAQLRDWLLKGMEVSHVSARVQR